MGGDVLSPLYWFFNQQAKQKQEPKGQAAGYGEEGWDPWAGVVQGRGWPAGQEFQPGYQALEPLEEGAGQYPPFFRSFTPGR